METYQDEINTPLTAAKAALAALKEAAETYNTNLLLSQERLEKLPMIERVTKWLTTQNARFETGDYGSSMSEVSIKLSSFAETFTSAVEAQEKVPTQEHPPSASLFLLCLPAHQARALPTRS